MAAVSSAVSTASNSGALPWRLPADRHAAAERCGAALSRDHSRSRRSSIRAAATGSKNRRPGKSIATAADCPACPMPSVTRSRITTGRFAHGCRDRSADSRPLTSRRCPRPGSGRSSVSAGRGSGDAARPKRRSTAARSSAISACPASTPLSSDAAKSCTRRPSARRSGTRPSDTAGPASGSTRTGSDIPATVMIPVADGGELRRFGGRIGHRRTDILTDARPLAIQAEGKLRALGHVPACCLRAQRVQIDRRPARIGGRPCPALPARARRVARGPASIRTGPPRCRNGGQPLPHLRRRRRTAAPWPARSAPPAARRTDRARAARHRAKPTCARAAAARICTRCARHSAAAPGSSPPSAGRSRSAEIGAPGRDAFDARAGHRLRRAAGTGRRPTPAPRSARRATPPSPPAPTGPAARRRRQAPARQVPRDRIDSSGQNARNTVSHHIPASVRCTARRTARGSSGLSQIPIRSRRWRRTVPRRAAPPRHSQSGMLSRASISSMVGRGRITA